MSVRSWIWVALLATAIGCSKRSSNDAKRTDAGAADATRSPAELLKRIEAACTQNDFEACRSLGILYNDGNGIPADQPRAVRLFDKACTGGNLAACNQLALAHAEGLGVPKDPARAVAEYQRACDGGHQLSCRNLGLMLRDGRGIAADLVRAAALLDRACTGGAPYACTNAGDLDAQLASAGDKAREKPMVGHYKKGCDDGDPTSCRQLGIAYLEGKGLPTSTAAAALWLERGCNADDPIACRVLGAMTVQGVGVPRDPERGTKLLTRACERRDEEACIAVRTFSGDAGMAPPEPHSAEADRPKSGSGGPE
ncbi:MAG: tetratricopeptide repeat protein [Kofleriaceae bacterium]